MSKPLILYTTAGCHLCEQAGLLLERFQQPFEPVDIAADPVLLERYGVRIPVLQRADGAELGWPFDAAQLGSFLQK